MGEWKTYRLGDICTLVAGFAFKSKDFGDYPNKVIKIADIQPPIVDMSSLTGIDISQYNCQKLEKYKTQKGDYVLAMTGATIGKLGRIVSKKNAYINQRVLLFKPIDKYIDKNYLYYYLCQNTFFSHIRNHIDSETAQPNISANSIGEFNVTHPPLEEQRRIAGILGALDDKIELNRRINANLEELAQALFRSWFVDFEPFRDGPFVDSELGKIPQGWKVAELGEVTKQQTEKVGPRTEVKVLSPITTGELVLSEEYFTKQVFSESIAKYIIVKPNQFAYNPARINIGSIGRNTFEFDGCVSPVYVVFECEKGYHYFFDFIRKTDAFKQEVISRAIGGVRQTLGYKDFALIKVVYPPQNVVRGFNTLYANLLNLQNHNNEETKTLSALRDTLLPKLMAGEINIEIK